MAHPDVVHHRWTDLDGLEVFYREAGPPDAPVVLLPHGYPCSSYEFRNFMPALADQFRLLAPDFPGCGYSATPNNHIDAIRPPQRIGTLYEVLEPSSVDAERRKRVGQLLSTRREKLAKVCVGCAYVSQSAIGRGVLTAVSWLVSPPFPMKAFDNVDLGLRWLNGLLPELDPERSYEQYAVIRSRHLSSALKPGS